MCKRSNAIVLSPEAPYPPAGGGALRTASIIEYLRQAWDVTVLVFREPGSPDPRIGFPADTEVHVIDLPFHAKHSAAKAIRNVRRALLGRPPLVDRFSGFEQQVCNAVDGRHFDLGVIEHFWCAGYSDVLRPACDRLVLDLHNVESLLLARQAEVDQGPSRLLFRRFAAACRDLETKWLPQFDHILVASEADAARLAVEATVVPNTIPLTPLPRTGKDYVIVFSGNLGYQPNQTAIRWFAERVWPDLRNRHPTLGWRVIGRNDECVRDLLNGLGRVETTGAVADAVAHLAAAQVAVVPILSGSGTRVKIIEAWAAGLPVVSTRIGAEGLAARDGQDLLIADTPSDFVSAVDEVLRSTELQTRLGANGRKLYEQKFTWNATWATLKAAGL